MKIKLISVALVDRLYIAVASEVGRLYIAVDQGVEPSIATPYARASPTSPVQFSVKKKKKQSRKCAVSDQKL